MERKNITRALKYTLSVILAAVFVWLAFRKVDWAAFLGGLQQTRWGFVVLFFAAALTALLFRTLRWKAILGALDKSIRPVTVWDANNVGNLANVVLPGSGELVRCGYVTSPKARYDKVLGTVILERVWDILAIACLLAGALIGGRDRLEGFFRENFWEPLRGAPGLSLWWIAALSVALVALCIWAVYHFRSGNRICGKIAGAVSGILKGFASFGRMEHKWLFALYTALIWLMYVCMGWSILKAMPDLSGLGFTDALLISAVGNIASVIPVPGGIGAYHYLVALTLSSLYGAGWDCGILYATLNHELHTVLIIALGVLSYFAMQMRKK